MILGPALEENFRRAMSVAKGNPAIFIHRPIAATLLAIAALLLLVMLLPKVKAAREEAFQE
jgi:TctA family transporter